MGPKFGNKVKTFESYCVFFILFDDYQMSKMNSNKNNIKISETVSQSINILRFPLSAFVVLEHYYPNKCVQVIPTNGIDIYTPFAKFLSIYLPTFAVPLFFLISGYLFFFSFRELNKFNYNRYLLKLKSRVKTLFIPYMLWNLIILILLVLGQYFTDNKIMPLEKKLSDLTSSDVLSSFWSISDKGFPIDGPLWFVRDLMVVLSLAPIIFLIIKKCKLVGIVIISVFYLLGIDFDLFYFPRTGFFYVTLGGYFALSDNDILSKLCNVNLKFAIFIIVCSILALLLATYYELPKIRMEQIRGIYEYIMVFIIWSPASHIKNKDISCFLERLSTPSFFLYAAHKPVIYVCCLATFLLISPSSNYSLCLLTLTIPFIVIIICLILFWIIKNFLPFLKCLNGYRL